MANHTSIHTLFNRTLINFDMLFKRGGYLDQYRKYEPTKDNLDEFNEAREVVTSLRDEYKSCERADYITAF